MGRGGGAASRGQGVGRSRSCIWGDIVLEIQGQGGGVAKPNKPERRHKERWAGKEAATKSRSRALQHTVNS